MCQKIVGYDANALYLWAIMQNMPTGSFTRRREETNFKKESSTKMATEWLEWKAHEGGIFIRHQMNNTEKRIGERKIPVDGFHGPSQTVFQFMAAGGTGIPVILPKEKNWTKREKDPWQSYWKKPKQPPSTSTSKWQSEVTVMSLNDDWSCTISPHNKSLFSRTSKSLSHKIILNCQRSYVVDLCHALKSRWSYQGLTPTAVLRSS